MIDYLEHLSLSYCDVQLSITAHTIFNYKLFWYNDVKRICCFISSTFLAPNEISSSTLFTVINVDWWHSMNAILDSVCFLTTSSSRYSVTSLIRSSTVNTIGLLITHLDLITFSKTFTSIS